MPEWTETNEPYGEPRSGKYPHTRVLTLSEGRRTLAKLYWRDWDYTWEGYSFNGVGTRYLGCFTDLDAAKEKAASPQIVDRTERSD